MKKSMILLSLMSSAAFAGTMGPICIGQSAAPCAQSAWSVSGQALYLQPRFSGANYWGTMSNAGIADDPAALVYPAVNDNWRWGFRLEGVYYFSTGNDLNVNWSYFANTTQSSTLTIPAGGSFADNVQNNYAGPAINTSRKPTWDAVNAEFGQRINFGEREEIRFHGGVQYAHIKTQTTYSSPTSTTATTYASAVTTYNGFGPRIGLDMTYNWRTNFAMYASGGTALLIGPNQFNDTASGPNATTWASLSGSTTAIVPEIEAKLGLKYTYALAQSDLILDAGWTWNNYFNAQQNSLGLVGESGQGGLQQSDFGLQGLYFGLKWRSNLA